MKLGEIKIEALKIMFADYTSDIDIDDLQELKTDENYGRYLSSMPGAINRCFSRIENSNATPLKKVTLQKSSGTVANGRIRFDLSSLFSDFGRVDRIIYETKYDYNGNCDYIMETDSIIILEEKDEDYILIYSPMLARITNSTDDNTEIQLSDKVACLIPYFIKGDLFREDEPIEASEARNLFEASLEALNNEIQRRQTKVRQIFSQTEE